jgi:arsenite methyltransferase
MIMSDLREQVRRRYAAAARAVPEGKAANDWDADEAGCCDPGEGLGLQLYDISERADVPAEAVLASLGCGNPTAVAELREGETVLDLGSGGGIDVLLSAKRVGRSGKAYGVDMTDEMLSLARDNARKAGAANVEFLKGYIEDVPLDDLSVDVIISNCVINLSTDKPAVFREMYRLLRSGGRLGISDVVAADELSPEQRLERGSHVGCIAGALSFQEYRAALRRAGFINVTIEPTNEWADRMFGAIIQAGKP